MPLIDGGTVRLPALIGLGRALDLILTGRPVPAREALAMGLVDRVVPAGQARAAAEDLARQLAALPQACLRSDRAAALEGISLPAGDAMANEFLHAACGCCPLRASRRVSSASVTAPAGAALPPDCAPPLFDT